MEKEKLELIKKYCKIDIDFEDDLLQSIIDGVESQICDAIEEGTTPNDFEKYPKFQLAVKKQVKEEYENRGLTAHQERYPLANGVMNIISQLRYRNRGESDEHSTNE